MQHPFLAVHTGDSAPFAALSSGSSWSRSAPSASDSVLCHSHSASEYTLFYYERQNVLTLLVLKLASCVRSLSRYIPKRATVIYQKETLWPSIRTARASWPPQLIPATQVTVSATAVHVYARRTQLTKRLRGSELCTTKYY